MPDGLHVLRGDAARFRAHEGVGAGDHERVPMLLAYAAHVEQGDGPVEQHLVEFRVPSVDAQDQGQHIVRGGEPGHGGGRLEQERHQRHGAEPVPALPVLGNGVPGTAAQDRSAGQGTRRVTTAPP